MILQNDELVSSPKRTLFWTPKSVYLIGMSALILVELVMDNNNSPRQQLQRAMTIK